MKNFDYKFLLFVTLVLTGCAHKPQDHSSLQSSIYLDKYFESNIELETPEQIFEISPQMRNYVKSRLLTINGTANRAKRLIKDLFSEQQINMGYLHNANFTAAETFDTRVANCLSLTILSYVLVKEANLSADFIDVEIAENWNQINGISMLNGHVNLKVSTKKQGFFSDFLESSVIIDFVPAIDIPVLSKRVLNKNEIVALYYNNKGGEFLALGQLNKAYRYLAEATRYDPKNASIWGNLASLYRQKGYYTEAELIYDFAMRLAPDNLNLKENIVLLYQNTDREVQAITMRKSVQNSRQLNPYYHAMLAEENYYKHDYHAAISYYKKAIRLNKTEHSFYFGLAKSYLMLNDFDNADKYLVRAKSMSSENKQKQQYQSKITALKNMTAKVH